jgi:alkylated DNA repair protein alkB homolog 1
LKSDFPPELTDVCRYVAQQVDTDLIPEAAIVNYYPLGSCMGGHLDDAEHTMSHPIVSLSIGRTALFLIGGRTKDIQPTPILLRSGDSVVMSGEARYCYHGIPGILSEEVEEKITGELSRLHSYMDEHKDSFDENKYTVCNYLRSNRINMNVRQVRTDVSTDSWIDKSGTGYVKYSL